MPESASSRGVSGLGGVCSGGVSGGGVFALGGVWSGGWLLWGEGVSAAGGSAPGGSGLGGLLPGGVVVVSQHALGQTTPLWTESQTPVKTLPWPNFVAAGYYSKLNFYQRWETS